MIMRRCWHRSHQTTPHSRHCTLTLPGAPFAEQDALHPVEQLLVDQRLMAAPVLHAVPLDEAG